MKNRYDVIIIGGGIVGLLSAYELAKQNKAVLVIEKRQIGSMQAASSGLTRSLRNDYQDPRYSRLARKAWERWSQLERELKTTLVVRSGCLNIASNGLAEEPYANQAAAWLKRDGNPTRELTGAAQVRTAFGQFSNVDYAVLDLESGMGLARRTLETVRDSLLALPNAELFEQCTVTAVDPTGAAITVNTDRGIFKTAKIVIAAGLGTPAILERIVGSAFRLELYPDKPVECLYYKPKNAERYTADVLPIFANLDVGVYGHPIVEGVTNAVKIGMYAPPEIVTAEAPRSVGGVKAFVRRYLPDLAKDAEITAVTDTDQCAYDMTPDGNFVIGPLPGNPNIVVAAGFCGTGFKFAPITAEIVRDVVLEGSSTYDTSAFSPGRF